MALDSSSTIDEIQAAYLDNMSYDVNGSVAECKAFIPACRALLLMKPGERELDKMRIRFDPALWQSQLDDALAWRKVNDTSLTSSQSGRSGARHFTMDGFRS